MKKFNETITVEVEVDNIADQLLNTFKEDNPHREMITETIIGLAIKDKNIGFLYNSLMGYTNEIDFKVGQNVVSTNSYWGYRQTPIIGQESEVKYERANLPIGDCVIVNIDNLKKEDKVKVSFFTIDSTGKSIEKLEWVNHRNLTNQLD